MQQCFITIMQQVASLIHVKVATNCYCVILNIDMTFFVGRHKVSANFHIGQEPASVILVLFYVNVIELVIVNIVNINCLCIACSSQVKTSRKLVERSATTIGINIITIQINCPIVCIYLTTCMQRQITHNCQRTFKSFG